MPNRAPVVLAITLAFALGAGGPAFGTANSWHFVRSPNFGQYTNLLYCVAGSGTADVWAVGLAVAPDLSDKGLIEHWDGSAWTLVLGPQPGDHNSLNGVDAVSSTDAWAVGSSDGGTLAERWDGAAWSVVPVPGPASAELQGVDAIASDDGWAVGDFTDQTGIHTLTVHWDGAAWAQVPSPNGPGDNRLESVVVVAHDDAWAVGYTQATDGTRLPLTEHWDGQAWTVVAVPAVGAAGVLRDVSATGSSDVWAVGHWDVTAQGPDRTLAVHWNGTSWTSVQPTTPGTSSSLSGVAALPGGFVWAVGNSGGKAIIERWNGSVWKLDGTTPRPPETTYLEDVTALGAHDAWTVGERGYNLQTLTEHYF
jgi:hypothetical protein